MTVESATFIGGPWDLHRVVLPDYPPVYRVPVIDRIPVVGFLSENTAPESVPFKVAVYHRERGIVEGRDHAIYLHTGTS